MKYVQVLSRVYYNSSSIPDAADRMIVAIENISHLSLEPDKTGLYRVWLNGCWIDVDRADLQKILKAMGLA